MELSQKKVNYTVKEKKFSGAVRILDNEHENKLEISLNAAAGIRIGWILKSVGNDSQRLFSYQSILAQSELLLEIYNERRSVSCFKLFRNILMLCGSSNRPLLDQRNLFKMRIILRAQHVDP